MNRYLYRLLSRVSRYVVGEVHPALSPVGPAPDPATPRLLQMSSGQAGQNHRRTSPTPIVLVHYAWLYAYDTQPCRVSSSAASRLAATI
jgi:hypothetical protein